MRYPYNFHFVIDTLWSLSECQGYRFIMAVGPGGWVRACFWRDQAFVSVDITPLFAAWQRESPDQNRLLWEAMRIFDEAMPVLAKWAPQSAGR